MTAKKNICVCGCNPLKQTSEKSTKDKKEVKKTK